MSHAKNTEKNAEDTEKNTGAVAPAIPWASASAASAEAAAATGSAQAAEPAEPTPAAKPKDRPEEPGHSDASERILSLRERFFRGGDIWAHLVFILVAAYALNYVTHAAADDIYVYRLGAVSLADGPDGLQLYSFRTRGLPFTYPPFAALLFYPLAFLTEPQSMMLITVIIGVLSYVCAYALYSYARSRAWRLPLQKYLSPWGMVSLMAALIWACGPWRLTTHFGQINAIILALILADFMRPATRVPRGVLLGIAAGIKLTPLAFAFCCSCVRTGRGLSPRP